MCKRNIGVYTLRFRVMTVKNNFQLNEKWSVVSAPSLVLNYDALMLFSRNLQPWRVCVGGRGGGNVKRSHRQLSWFREGGWNAMTSKMFANILEWVSGELNPSQSSYNGVHLGTEHRIGLHRDNTRNANDDVSTQENGLVIEQLTHQTRKTCFNWCKPDDDGSSLPEEDLVWVICLFVKVKRSILIDLWFVKPKQKSPWTCIRTLLESSVMYGNQPVPSFSLVSPWRLHGFTEWKRSLIVCIYFHSRDDPPADYLSCSISQSPAFSWGRSELTDRNVELYPQFFLELITTQLRFYMVSPQLSLLIYFQFHI